MLRARSGDVFAARTPAKAATRTRRAFQPIASSTSVAEKIREAHLAVLATCSLFLLRRPGQFAASPAATIFVGSNETKKADVALRRRLNYPVLLLIQGPP